MRQTTFFLIEPNAQALREFPTRVQKDIVELLLDPLLTSRDYGDRSKWQEADIEIAVKLLHVARLREYIPFANDDDARRILGSECISAEVFDRWWTIRRLGLEEGRSEEMEDYLVALAEKFQPTGNQLVDDWVWGLSTDRAPNPSFRQTPDGAA